MKAKEATYEVNLSIIELRGLPTSLPRHGPCRYQIRASLNDVVHETDEVSSSSHLSFKNDFAWSLSRSSYHYLRSHKVPIRITVLQNSKKVGHLVLDLKEAFPLPVGTAPTDFFETKSQWTRLLGSKKDPSLSAYPSIKWVLSMNTLSESEVEGDEVNEKVKAPSTTSSHQEVQVLLNEKEGFFLVGSNPCEAFHLKIEIYFASNLHLVMNKDLTELVKDDNYHFSYNIFGENITTVPFSNLKEPNFSVEEATINIRSSFSDIVEYFSQQPPFCVSVCSSRFILARICISIRDFLELTESNLREKGCLKSSRAFPFENSKDSSIGISISIRSLGALDDRNTNSENKDREVSIGSKPSNSPRKSTSDDNRMPQSIISPAQTNDNEMKSYRLIIDLKSIHFDNNLSKKIRLRYKYAPLKKDEEIDTYDFQVEPNLTVRIPYGRCQFVFNVEPKTCLQILKKYPLIVKVLDVCNCFQAIGQSEIALSEVLVGECSSHRSKEVEISAPVLNLVNRRIGTLVCMVSLIVGSNSSDNCHSSFSSSLKYGESSPRNDSLKDWKKRERQKIEEHYKLEWDKRESERSSCVKAKIQECNQLEQIIQDYVKKHRSMESSLNEKDSKIVELNRKASIEANKNAKRVTAMNKEICELTESHKSKVKELLNKIKGLEKVIERMKEDSVKESKRSKQLENENVRLSSELKKLSDENIELKVQFQIAQSRSIRNQVAVDRIIHGEIDASSMDKNPATLTLASSGQEEPRPLDIEQQIKRLNLDRESILKTGDFNADDEIVQNIARKINSLS